MMDNGMGNHGGMMNKSVGYGSVSDLGSVLWILSVVMKEARN